MAMLLCYMCVKEKDFELQHVSNHRHPFESGFVRPVLGWVKGATDDMMSTLRLSTPIPEEAKVLVDPAFANS